MTATKNTKPVQKTKGVSRYVQKGYRLCYPVKGEREMQSDKDEILAHWIAIMRDIEERKREVLSIDTLPLFAERMM